MTRQDVEEIIEVCNGCSSVSTTPTPGHSHKFRMANPRPFPARLVRDAIFDVAEARHYYLWQANDTAENDERLDFADAVVARLRELIASREKEG